MLQLISDFTGKTAKDTAEMVVQKLPKREGELKTANTALDRFFNLDNDKAGMYYWRGREVTVDAEKDQPVWTGGEYTGRTPVSMRVIPGGLTVAVP